MTNYLSLFAKQGYDIDFPIYAGSYRPHATDKIARYGELRADGEDNLYGGIFGSFDKDVAESHGSYLRTYFTKNHISHDDLYLDVFDSDDAVKQVKDIFSQHKVENLSDDEATEMLDWIMGDNDIYRDEPDMGAERFREILCLTDEVDISWDLQGLKGELARRRGYDSVGMPDEHGESVLILNAVTAE